MMIIGREGNGEKKEREGEMIEKADKEWLMIF